VRRLRVLLFACLAGCCGAPAIAQSDFIKPGEERFTIILGTFLSTFDSNLRIDNASMQGTPVNVADDLGADRETAGVWVGVEWRFAPRHRIGLTYSRLKVSGARTATRQIQIGDEIFPVGATISSEMKLTLIPALYSYSLFKSETDELAVTVGLHWSSISFKAQGSSSLGMQDTSADVSAKTDVPLPLIGLRWDHHFSQRWSAGLQGGAFSLGFGKGTLDIEGDIWSAAAYGEYRFSKHLAVGLTVDAIHVAVDASGRTWRGTIEYDHWGPQLFLKARF
jgi:hypothetical protein